METKKKVKRITITESQLYPLHENAKDRKINDFIKDFLNTKDFTEARNFLLTQVYGRFPRYRNRNAQDTINLINTCYEKNNGKFKEEFLPYQSNINWIGNKALQKITDGQDLQTTSNSNIVTRQQSQKQIKTPKGYTITRIDSQQELSDIANGEWCVARDPDDDGETFFDDFIGNDGATVYLATADYADSIQSDDITITDEDGEEEPADWYYEAGERLSQEDFEHGKKNGTYPFDKYGLSELIVITYPGGDLSIWSRWNLEGGWDGGHTYLTPQELSQVVGADYKSTFPFIMGTNYNNGNLQESAFMNNDDIETYEKRTLKEGATKRLFHYIDSGRLIKILRNNRFYPSEPEMYNNIKNGRMEYIDGPGQRFMSFTRNKNFHSGYPVLAYGEVGSNGYDGIVCRLEIDGNALNTYNNFKVKNRWGQKQNNFKVRPMDFVYKDYGDGKGDPMRIQDETGVYAHNGKEWMMQSDGKTYFGWDGQTSPPLSDRYAHSMSQAEDRLTTTAKSIPNANRYITRIDIYTDPTMNDSDDNQDRTVRKIQTLAGKLGIPTRMYRAPYLQNFSLGI